MFQEGSQNFKRTSEEGFKRVWRHFKEFQEVSGGFPGFSRGLEKGFVPQMRFRRFLSA